MSKIIVTGGCGYIGSHTCIALLAQGYEVVVFDDFSNASKESIERIEKIVGKRPELCIVDLKNKNATSAAFEAHKEALAVIHFAAYKAVKESVDRPLQYYENNFFSLINTLVMFEGVPSYPTYGRFWDLVQTPTINPFYTAPTAIRALAKQGDGFVNPCDLSSLKVLGTVGEPINDEAWQWYNTTIGKNKCPIVDTWWQTETGGILISPIPNCFSCSSLEYGFLLCVECLKQPHQKIIREGLDLILFA